MSKILPIVFKVWSHVWCYLMNKLRVSITTEFSLNLECIDETANFTLEIEMNDSIDEHLLQMDIQFLDDLPKEVQQDLTDFDAVHIPKKARTRFSLPVTAKCCWKTIFWQNQGESEMGNQSISVLGYTQEYIIILSRWENEIWHSQPWCQRIGRDIVQVSYGSQKEQWWQISQRNCIWFVDVHSNALSHAWSQLQISGRQPIY